MSHQWHDEYDNPQVVSLGVEPQSDVVKFLKYLDNNDDYDPHGKVFVDMGCGVGKNAIYIAEKYSGSGFGYDIADNAIAEAKNRSGDMPITYATQSIAEPIPIEDSSVDIVIDVMTSHVLKPDERNVYLAEVHRILQPGGWFFMRTFTRDGDRNAQNLLKHFPTDYYDTYHHPDLDIDERVFREEDFRELFGLYFDIIELYKTTGYQRRGNQSYKRRYIVAYMRKK